jgi:hypothetical protein
MGDRTATMLQAKAFIRDHPGILVHGNEGARVS